MSCRSVAALTVAVVLAVVGLSGCSGGPTAAATAARPEDSPLGHYLAVFSDAGASDSELAANKAQVEEAIAACMAAQGFEYTPEPYDATDRVRPSASQLDDEEWVAQWGYGVDSFPGSSEGGTLSGMSEVNDAYVQNLGAAEQAAYAETMWGPPITDEQIAANIAGGEGRTTWEQEGCRGQGAHEVNGDDPRDSSQFQPLVQALAAFQNGELQAPEFDGVNADWSNCMASAGYPGFVRQADAETSIRDASDEIYSNSSVPLESSDPSLVALQDREVALALTDLDCRTQVDYRARAQTIQYGLEDRFVADHRTELDELVAAATQGR